MATLKSSLKITLFITIAITSLGNWHIISALEHKLTSMLTRNLYQDREHIDKI